MPPQLGGISGPPLRIIGPAAWCAASRPDDRVLAALAGHRDPRSIERYAKLQITSALKRLREEGE
jgi:hypothetical protein